MKALLPKLQNVTWKVGISPWAGMRPECLDNKSCDAGLELEFLDTLARMLGVKVDFVETETTGCGNVDRSGVWTGLMGMLQSDEIDLTGNNCAVDQWRLNQNFSKIGFPVLQDKQHFLLKVPEPKFGFRISQPFQMSLWIALLIIWWLFLYAHVFALKLYSNENNLINSLSLSLNIMLSVVKNMHEKGHHIHWLFVFWASFVGYFATVYSMYITGILLRPLSIERPFETSHELAQKLYTGEYTLLDYRPKVSYPMCYGDTCDLLQKSINLRGYKYVKLGTTAAELNEFLYAIQRSPKDEPLVLVQSKQYMDFYLKNFPDKGQLWLYEDELVGQKWYTYYFRKDFQYRNLLNKAVIAVGDFKANLFRRHWRASRFVRMDKRISGEISHDTSLSVEQFTQPFIWYFTVLLGTIFVLTVEICTKKRRFLWTLFIYMLNRLKRIMKA